MKVAALITCAAAACGLVLLLNGEGDQTESPAASRTAPPVRPTPPARYRVPRGAIRVSTSRQLHAALASAARRTIVLAAGAYESRRPFLNPHGHRIYAARRGRAVLRAGLSLGGNAGRPGALVRGVVVDIDDARRTVDGAAIAVWGTGRDVRILDTVLRGNGVTRAGISAQQPEGLEIRRVVVRRFTDFGIFVDANELDRGPLSSPFRIRDADVAACRPARSGIVERQRRGVHLDRQHRLDPSRAPPLVRMDGPVDRDVNRSGPGRRGRRRPHTHGRVRRALHARQHVPAAAHRAPASGSG